MSEVTQVGSVVALSEAAATKVRDLLNREGRNDLALRVAVEQHGAALKLQNAPGIDDEAVYPDSGFGTDLDLCRRTEPQRQPGPCSGSDEVADKHV